MGLVSLVTFLRTNQLHRPEKELLPKDDDPIEIQQPYLGNPRRSRLVHCHICTESDEFSFDIDSYVGLLIFSYDNQPKFILNSHHCQRGDIIIKQINSFSRTQKMFRGLYDNLFRWYFNRSIDEKFFGVGFLYLNGKWRFDLITYDDRDLFTYEYRIFDMYILTHWLTQLNIPHNVQEMERNAKYLLLEQYDIVQKKLIELENTELLLDNWIEFIDGNKEDLKLSIEIFHQIIGKEIDIIFKESTIRTNSFSALFTVN
jgi:hypothetical protein